MYQKYYLNILFLALVVLTSAFSQPASAKSKIHVLKIENMKFPQNIIAANSGDMLIWKNDDLVPHTVTSENGLFDSGVIESGKSWKFKVKKSGLFKYKCIFHPEMKAQFQVQ